MPILLADRAATTSPLPLLTSDDARLLGIRLSGPAHRRLRPGVWVDAAAFDALPPWGKYAVRVHAFSIRHPDAILCLESAAAVRGLPLFGHPRRIHVHAPESTASRTVGDVQFHASVDEREVDSTGGILTTSLPDTVIGLGRVLPPAQALAIADAAISPVQGGTLALPELEARAGAQANGRGRARLRWLFAHADGGSESPGESVSRAVIHWSGFAVPRLQQEFRCEGAADRVDFFFPDARVIGESDGWGKYDLGDPEAAERHLRNEKLREDRLRRAGHGFARWDLDGALRVAPLCRALTAAGLHPERPPQSAMLATLRRSPRCVPAPANRRNGAEPTR